MLDQRRSRARPDLGVIAHRSTGYVVQRPEPVISTGSRMMQLACPGMANGPSSGPGPGVDAYGRTVIDPSENVKALTEASVKALRDLSELRAHYDELIARNRYQYETRLANQRVRYDTELRAADKELRKAESDRIDAIRAVDVGAVQRAAEVSAAQAEALRNTVAAAAAAAATALGAALDPIQKDIADLRRAQYEAQGQKTQVVEGRQGVTFATGLIGFGVAAGLGLLGFLAFGDTPAAPDPVVIEVPANP
jgi:hypothetical protein